MVPKVLEQGELVLIGAATILISTNNQKVLDEFVVSPQKTLLVLYHFMSWRGISVCCPNRK
jgi:hypothetical protein